jgi:hypothetical protein
VAFANQLERDPSRVRSDLRLVASRSFASFRFRRSLRLLASGGSGLSLFYKSFSVVVLVDQISIEQSSTALPVPISRDKEFSIDAG